MGSQHGPKDKVDVAEWALRVGMGHVDLGPCVMGHGPWGMGHQRALQDGDGEVASCPHEFRMGMAKWRRANS